MPKVSEAFPQLSDSGIKSEVARYIPFRVRLCLPEYQRHIFWFSALPEIWFPSHTQVSADGIHDQVVPLFLQFYDGPSRDSFYPPDPPGYQQTKNMRHISLKRILPSRHHFASDISLQVVFRKGRSLPVVTRVHSLVKCSPRSHRQSRPFAVRDGFLYLKNLGPSSTALRLPIVDIVFYSWEPLRFGYISDRLFKYIFEHPIFSHCTDSMTKVGSLCYPDDPEIEISTRRTLLKKFCQGPLSSFI